MTRPFRELPLEHVAATLLAWRIARKLAARDCGWSLASTTVSRKWRFRVGASSWTAQVLCSFFFGSSDRGPGAVHSIFFVGKGSVAALKRSALFQELCASLGEAYQRREHGKDVSLGWVLRKESRPRILLAELDRIAAAFGTTDRHSPPSSRARAPERRLWALAEAVLAHGTWTVGTPVLRIEHGAFPWSASLSPIPSSRRRRAELATLIFCPGASVVDAMTRRPRARGYRCEGDPSLVLMRAQPLSMRAAMAEATFLERELAHFAGA
ncbi:MAG TPA: hypothetical protein VF316_21385 [Polyangiaceae bacterium]